MNLERITAETEEPLPGWLRFEREGEKPWYKTPIPRKVIRTAQMLREFIAKENDEGRMIGIDLSGFSFKRRLGLRIKSSNSVPQVNRAVSTDQVVPQESVIERLTRKTNVDNLDHRRLLLSSAKLLDQFRDDDGYQTPNTFEPLKQKISSSSDLREMLAMLNKESCMNDAMNLMFSDTCLSEISKLNTYCGPLVDFPSSVNSNLYCNIVEQGMKECPNLMKFVINMVTRRSEPILPSHVLKVATLFASICYAANHELDALNKLRSLSLQVDGLSNVGLDMLSDVGLSQCARSIANHRDQFADIGLDVMNSTASKFPYQSTLDNCDIQSEHLTVETVEKETIDTSHLDTTKMTKAEAFNLFRKELIFLGSEENCAEKDHFLYTVALIAAKVLVKERPAAANAFSKFLTPHHEHENSSKELTPAVTFIIKPYPYTETKNADTIKMAVRIQRQFLKSVAKFKDDDPAFHRLLAMLEDPDLSNEEREAAEKRVMEAVEEYGVWIGHGDLLTVKMFLEAKMLMKGSASAFGRLEFLGGPFRLQLLHMKMRKVVQVTQSVCRTRSTLMIF